MSYLIMARTPDNAIVQKILPEYLQQEAHLVMRLLPGKRFGRVTALFCRHELNSEVLWKRRKFIGPHPSASHFGLVGAWAVSYLLEGEAILREEGEDDRRLKPGSLFHIRVEPDQMSKVTLIPVTRFLDCSMFFDLARAQDIVDLGLFDERFDPVDIGIKASLVTGYLQLFESIVDVNIAPSAVFRQAIGLLDVISNEIEGCVSHDAFTIRAKRVLRENPQPCFSMREAAAALNMSYSTFRRTFKRATGISPGEYQLRERMNHARDLLRFHSVRQTAGLLGYTDEYFFSNQFKKMMGVSPAHFRE